MKMAERTGLEPATPGVTGRYSNQLNYRSTFSIISASYLGKCITLSLTAAQMIRITPKGVNGFFHENVILWIVCLIIRHVGRKASKTGACRLFFRLFKLTQQTT